MRTERYIVLFQQVHAIYHKDFHLLKGAKTPCSTILTGPPTTTWRHNKPTGKAGLLPGCRVKDLEVTGVHMVPLVMDTDIIIVMSTAGADHAAPSDAASVSSAL